MINYVIIRADEVENIDFTQVLENSAETLPYFELTTSNGKTDSNQFLADARPEFLLFISPN